MSPVVVVPTLRTPPVLVRVPLSVELTAAGEGDGAAVGQGAADVDGGVVGDGAAGADGHGAGVGEVVPESGGGRCRLVVRVPPLRSPPVLVRVPLSVSAAGAHGDGAAVGQGALTMMVPLSGMVPPVLTVTVPVSVKVTRG